MKTSFVALAALIAASLAGAAAAPAAAQVLYVDKDATGANSGTSWANAFTSLQSALDVAVAGSQVHVAEGTYLPTKLTNPANPRSATFMLVSGASVLGGYAGAGAPDPDERDVAAHPTILSGDIGTPGLESDNATHVVSASTGGSSTMLDGFTITLGRASPGVQPVDVAGGGLFLQNGASLKLRSCTFEDNLSDGDGGAIYAVTGSPEIVGCTFAGNKTQLNGLGGAIYGQQDLVLTDCTFADNDSAFAEGAVSISGNVTATRCLFEGNSSVLPDGALSSGSATLRDCTFRYNAAGFAAGAVSVGTLDATNCLFVGNGVHDNTLTQVGGLGGAIVAGSATLTNCRFFGNYAGASFQKPGSGGALYVTQPSTLVNCLFSGNRCMGAFAGSSTPAKGGAIYATATATLVHCTLAGNQAETPDLILGSSAGGGVYGPCVLSNTILWGNADWTGTGESAQVTGGLASPNQCCIQGLTGALGGAGNIGTNPKFIDADGADDVVGTEDDDLRLRAASPCVDAASVLLDPSDTADLDCDGDVAEKVALDLGLVGRYADDLAVADTGPGPAPDSDMGAYERSAWTNLGHQLGGSNGEACLVGNGTLAPQSFVVLGLAHALPNGIAWVCVGFANASTPFKGGTMVPLLTPPGFAKPFAITSGGSLALLSIWPAGVPSGFTFYAQEWFADPGAPKGAAASNAVAATTP
jgi:predicted outer membrane repeat protein